MTGAQKSYLHTLAEEAGEELDDEMTKAEASEKIDELQKKTGARPAEIASRAQQILIRATSTAGCKK